MGRHTQRRPRVFPVWYTALLVVASVLAVPTLVFLGLKETGPPDVGSSSNALGCLGAAGCPTAGPATTARAGIGAAQADSSPTPTATRTKPVSRGTRNALPALPRTVPLGPYVNNDGIGIPTSRQVGFDGTGTTFPQPAAAVGNRAIDGVPYRLLGARDNVVARGQTVDLPDGRYGRMRLLAAASFGPAGGTATIRYADGTTEKAALRAPDWVQGGAGALRSPIRYGATGKAENTPVNIYALSVPLDARRTVASIVLPVTAIPARDAASLHIFAITLVPAA